MDRKGQGPDFPVAPHSDYMSFASAVTISRPRNSHLIAPTLWAFRMASRAGGGAEPLARVGIYISGKDEDIGILVYAAKPA